MPLSSTLRGGRLVRPLTVGYGVGITIFCNYCYYCRHNCSDKCGNGIVIPMSGNYCCYYSHHDCSDDCGNDIVIPMLGSYCRYYNRDDCSNDIIIPMSGSFLRYYSHHAIVVTTVVTTVATKNCKPTHAIFFLIYGCPMSSTVYQKKLCPSQRQWRRHVGLRSAPWHKRAASQKRQRTRILAHMPSLPQ